MDLQVRKLDEAYVTSERLTSATLTNAQKIAEEMAKIINNMNNHWKGADATIHINKWIDVYNEFNLYFRELNKTSNYFQSFFVNLQVGRARASTNQKVGDKNSKIYEFVPINKIDTTSEYYHHPELSNDCTDLHELCTAYDKFIGYTQDEINQIFNNWKIGIGREKVGKRCQKIDSYAKKISSQIHELCAILDVIVHNFEKISNS